MNNTAFALMVAISVLLVHAFLQARAGEIVVDSWRPPRSAS